MVQPIAVVDALDAFIGALDYTGPSRHFEVGGPGQLRYGALLESYTSHAGLNREQVHVPLLPTALVAADDDFRRMLLPQGHPLVGLDEAFPRCLAAPATRPEGADPMGSLPQDPAWASGGGH
ncbi:MAG: epimerase, partial [Ornithinimicrobium sp.]|nr:epimerase [Ornithinimicrobium sp.]